MTKTVYFDGFEDAEFEASLESLGFQKVDNLANAHYVVYGQDPQRQTRILPLRKKDVALVNLCKALIKRGWADNIH